MSSYKVSCLIFSQHGHWDNKASFNSRIYFYDLITIIWSLPGPEIIQVDKNTQQICWTEAKTTCRRDKICILQLLEPSLAAVSLSLWGGFLLSAAQVVVEEFRPTPFHKVVSVHWGLQLFVCAQLSEGPTTRLNTETFLLLLYISCCDWDRCSVASWPSWVQASAVKPSAFHCRAWQWLWGICTDRLCLLLYIMGKHLYFGLICPKYIVPEVMIHSEEI